MEVYKVGGAVRDELLGLAVKDRDWVVVGTTAETLEASGYRRVGKDFPVFLHPDSHEEYALARTERKTGPGYKGFEIHAAPDVTLEDDLRRRDLTINAIAENVDGQIIDPFNGREDLERGILRHVSPAFVEDPLRVLRVARFAARFGFSVAPETMALMSGISASGEIESLVAERAWTEWDKALGETSPRTFIEVLRECGALSRLCPELEKLFGVPQPAKYHPEIDTGIHILLVLDLATELSAEREVRFAAMVHDFGKGETPREQWPGHRGHEERGVDLIRAFCDRYRVPNHYRDLAVLVSRYHSHCHRAAELRPATILKVLEGTDAFRQPERFERFLLACESDARGRAGLEGQAYFQADILRSAQAAADAISVSDLAGLPGGEIGERLHERRVKAIKTSVGNSQS
jgi:tRNA nucleotidyltransferase (CCA-adding enzyme)